MTTKDMRLAFAVTAFFAAAVGSADAANLALPVKAPAAPAFSWTGLYIGGNAGGSIGIDPTANTGVLSSTATAGGIPVGTNVMFNESFRHVPVGGVAGGQIGYNWQWFSNWVAGLEADWDWTWQRDTATVSGCNSPPSLGFFAGPPIFGAGTFGQCMADEHKITSLGTARARTGYLAGNSLWYVTGGAAWGHAQENYSYTSSINPTVVAAGLFPTGGPLFLPTSASFSQNRVGC
jgi:outer membrane immunogenic protein